MPSSPPRLRGECVSEISVIAINAFLIPGFFVNDDDQKCTEQKKRAREIGALIDELGVDVAVMQEVWGTGMWNIESGMGPDFLPIPWCRSWRTSWVDTVVQYLGARGGLYMAHRVSTGMRVAAVQWRQFRFSNTKSKKGMVMVRYALPNDDRCLIVVNFHSDPTNAHFAIERQVEDLLRFINETVVAASAFMAGAECSRCGLVVVGGFNADVKGVLGKKLYTTLGVVDSNNLCPTPKHGHRYLARDLYGDYCRRTGVEPEATYDSKENKMVLWDTRVGERIDWQLAIDIFEGRSMARLECTKAEVVKRLISDHWSVLFRVKFQDGDG